jgi:hypothetical protein
MAFRVAAWGKAMFRFAAAANPCTRRFGCAADFNGVHKSFPKKAVDKMDPSETLGAERHRDRPSSQSLNAPVEALLRDPRQETPISPTRATTSTRFSS